MLLLKRLEGVEIHERVHVGMKKVDEGEEKVTKWHADMDNLFRLIEWQRREVQRSLSMFTLNTVCTPAGYTECLEGGMFKESRGGETRQRLCVTIYLRKKDEMDAWRIERHRVEKGRQWGRWVSRGEDGEKGRERSIRARVRAVSVTTDKWCSRSAHHL